MNEVVCPKCSGAMRSFERNGVTIEQCNECRGVFLDRGELDKLIDAEQQYVQRNAPQQPQPQQQQQYGAPPAYPMYRDDDDYYKDRHRYKKKRGFFGELFDD
jgi:Zn-finger nucleic acid-binding protein